MFGGVFFLPQHVDLLKSINNMAVLHTQTGSSHWQEPLYQEALEARRATLGNNHPETLTTVSNTAVLYKMQGKLSQAEPLYREALETRTRMLGELHPDTFSRARQHLLSLLQAQNKLTEAEAASTEALAACRVALGSCHPHAMGMMMNLSSLLQVQHRFDEAEPLLREALDNRTKHWAPLIRVQCRAAMQWARSYTTRKTTGGRSVL